MNDTSTTEAMSPVDHAWLKMDSIHNPMVMVGILELRTKRSTEVVAVELLERLLRYPRFSQVADDAARPPAWRPVESLDSGYHVHVHTSAEVPNQTALMTAVHKELGCRLDHHRPLWRVSLFRGRRGRLVILFRAHHAIADGVAMLRLLRKLDDHAEPKEPVAGVEPVHKLQAGPLGSLIHRLESLNSVLVGATNVLREEWKHPERLREQVRNGEDLAAAILRVLRLPSDNPASLSGPLSGQRHVAWTSPLPIDPLHRFARQHGVTLNDVFLAALGPVFRRHLQDTGRQVAREETLRITIPVNLRTETDSDTGNNFGLVLLDLPVGEPYLAVRLKSIAAQMRTLKDSPEARAVLLSLGIAGQLPEAAEHSLIDLVADKSVAVVSNLPGPERTLHIAAAEVENMTFFPPQAGHIGIGISLIGYADHLTAGISADRNRIADPQRFIRHLQRELRK